MKDWITRWEAFLRLERLGSVSALFKARTVYVTAMVFTLTQAVNAGQMYIAYEGWDLDHALLAVAIAIFWLCTLSLRKFANFDFISVLWGTVILLGVGASAIVSGVGINSALLPSMVAGVMIVALLGTVRSLIIYCVSALLLTLCMHLTSSQADLAIISDPAYIALRNSQRTMQTVIAVGLVGIVMALLTLNLNTLFKRLENSLQKSRAAEASRMQFLADMSHELRTPLNGVLGMNQLLLRTDLDETQRNYAQIVDESGSGMITVIDDILDLARLESDGIVLKSTDFNPAKMLDSVMALHQANAAAKGLNLSLMVESGLPDLFTGDHGRLRQIMSNLISNAVKFTDTGHVAVSLRGQPLSQGCWWLNFFVEDSGIGIPKDRQAGVFDRYEQAQDGQTNIVRGSGLGLAISRELTELMGGEINVVSEPAVGCRFCVAIPLTKVTPKTTRAGGDPKLAPDVNGAQSLTRRAS